MDAGTGKVLAAVNPHVHLAIASTTKVMTAVLALKLGRLSDRITVPKSAFNYEWDATVMGLHAGQTVTLRDLLYGLMLPSGADAANTIAIHYGGSESKWVALMNKKAAQLGMHDTHYLTAHGLDAKGQYSSAYDLALLGVYASSFPALIKITSTHSYTWDGHVLQNLNHVINWYPGDDGLKPGFTDAAGMCQLLDARRNGRHVVAAILNTPDMVIDARNLLNFGLRDFSWHQTSLPGDGPGLTISGSDSRGRSLYFAGSGHYVRYRLLQGFVADGSLPSLGYPRTEALQEGKNWVQYFQGGVLSRDPSGRVTRLPIGLTPVTATKPPVSPTPAATTHKGTIKPRSTPTPVHATPKPETTPTPSPSPTVAVPLQGFVKAHPRLGAPATHASRIHGYLTQLFRYGALASRGRTVWLLPLGDRLLVDRGYLSAHPGNVYPSGFAPASVLKAIGWLSP